VAVLFAFGIGWASHGVATRVASGGFSRGAGTYAFQGDPQGFAGRAGSRAGVSGCPVFGQGGGAGYPGYGSGGQGGFSSGDQGGYGQGGYSPGAPDGYGGQGGMMQRGWRQSPDAGTGQAPDAGTSQNGPGGF
jgi:hypothetical protein